ncbi:MAG: hypothetical protein RLZZ387_2910 [Chloroflexota bacterium]
MTTTSTTATTHTVRQLLVGLADDPAIAALGEEAAYRALRAGLHALLAGLERPGEPSLALVEAEEHLLSHCARCGAALGYGTERWGGYPRCCAACVAAGRAAGGPLIDAEVPLAPAEREELLALYERARGCAEGGAVEMAWELVGRASMLVDQAKARPLMVAVWLLAGELAVRRGDPRYGWRMLHRAAAWAEQIGDAASVARAEALLDAHGLRRFDAEP